MSSRCSLICSILCAIVMVMNTIHGLNLSIKTSSNTHAIPVPYIHQIVDYSCGDSALNMILTYYYPQKPIDQRAIIDVLRTSNHTGTLSLDVVRGARFSPLSSTPTSQAYVQFPQQAPKNGWFGLEPKNSSVATLPINIYEHSGLVTVYYPERNTLLPCEQARKDDTKCWVEHLVNEFLKKDIPVICLMNFEGNSGGHYRVAIGYRTEQVGDKEKITHIIMLDPWDRNNNPTTAVYSVDVFCALWKHAEPNDDKTCFKPFFGVAVFPLSVSTSQNNKDSYNIKVQYPCVSPPETKENPNLPLTTTIQHLFIEISLLSKPNNKGEAKILFTENIPLARTFQACNTHMMTWDFPKDVQEAHSVRVIAKGMVCDEVLPTEYNTGVWSPAYKYCDYVGGASIYQIQ